MSDMVERVARAMLVDELTRSPGNRRTFDDLWEDEKYVWLANSRAAIEAMREPTETVLRAGVDAFFVWDDSAEYDTVQHLARPVWNAMVDAALTALPTWPEPGVYHLPGKIIPISELVSELQKCPTSPHRTYQREPQPDLDPAHLATGD